MQSSSFLPFVLLPLNVLVPALHAGFVRSLFFSCCTQWLESSTQPSLTVRRCRRPSSSTPSSAVWYVLPSLYPLFNQALALRLVRMAATAFIPARQYEIDINISE